MSGGERLPEGLLVAFYGDDFTGSSAVMEVMTFAGLPTALFLDVPRPDQLARFVGYRGVGIAGVARSKGPDWMDAHLPDLFRSLAGLGAPLTHYKVCSTFDSAPHVGSIGRAIDIAAPILGGDWIPLLVAAPGMERFQAFGNLFASVNGEGFRLDRHPTMARHPVTPMDEADLRLHLARQTAKPIGLVDLVAMKRGLADAALARERGRADIVSLDVVDDETLAEAGRLVWENRGRRLFGVGSQGVQYALVAHWLRTGAIERPNSPFRAGPVRQIACVSGSCSPVTAGQIAHASADGFTAVPVDAAAAIDPGEWEREIGRVRDACLRAVGAGSSALAFTAAGPEDPAVAAMRDAIATAGASPEEVNDRVGAGLGRILSDILAETGLRRAVIAGGDTSGHAAGQLGIYALTALAPIAPGSPLCRAHVEDGQGEGFEIALKGGQVGQPDFFSLARAGGRAP